MLYDLTFIHVIAYRCLSYISYEIYLYLYKHGYIISMSVERMTVIYHRTPVSSKKLRHTP